MEPNKFDNHIKNVLEQRSIEPSVNAWSKLESKLDKAEKKKKMPWFFISGIAATLVGVLLMVNISKTNTNTFVDTNNSRATEIDVTSPEVSNVNNDVAASNVVNDNIDSNATSSNTNESTEITKTKHYLNTTNNKPNRLYASTSNEKRIKGSIVENKKNKTINESTLVAITNTNEIIENETTNTSEIDDLLNNALLAVKSTETETIDAESLLYDVEVEVEQTFRTKMFAKVKENAINLKTAFVERNK